MSEVRNKAQLAKQAAFRLGRLSTEEKNQALLIMADALIQRTADIMEANAEDLRRGKELGTLLPCWTGWHRTKPESRALPKGCAKSWSYRTRSATL